ncbi:MAG: DNA repair protein RecN [Clostridia bacterium]|nr:DNA repair protein RecN [Clostridia bacterium]
MLGQLHIKNIGIIDEINIDFENGLNILTGETGAGKSLIIDSINAITGSRVSKDIIRTDEDMAFVEAYFYDQNEDYVLTREIYQNGRNICKINGRLVTVSELKELGSNLIDIHGQHDNQSLLDEKTHIDLLDGFAGVELEKLKKEYANYFEKYKDVLSRVQKNYGDESERARKLDLLNYQINEIEVANLKLNEEEDLLNRRKILLNSEKISSSLNTSHDAINNNILEELSEVTRAMSSISDLNPRYQDVFKEINEAYYNLEDAVDNLADLAMDVEFDEDEQADIEQRLDLISNLKRKYGKSIEEILEFLEKSKQEKQFLENSEEIVEKLKKEQKDIVDKLNKIADSISQTRKEYAAKIEKKINSQMQDLEMKKAYLEFKFTKSDLFLPNGKDEVELLICTNVGDELKPLSKIASGGELSRVMLAIKSVLGEYDKVPTMIFDEIDTGISGQAGKAVADKLRIIANTHQVICVTHLASIAAAGNTNFYIDKQVKNNKTKTMIKKLNEEEVIKEIARVIAGNDITKSVLDHAKELRS